MANELMTAEREDEFYVELYNNFCKIATVQGRTAYFLMSIYIANPESYDHLISPHMYDILMSNMVYGLSFMLLIRPSMKELKFQNKLTFGFLGSMMFSYSTISAYQWILSKMSGYRAIWKTLITFFTGRILMLHLLAFFYHIDTRMDPSLPRNDQFEILY